MSETDVDVDVVIVGSGFGGAVAACRLSAQGYRVLVLDRGRRWTPEEYPRGLRAPWFYSPTAPHRRNGWFDVRFLDQMIVVTGAGVGGGSLVYANVCIDAPSSAFESGWPPEITADELEPYYRRAAAMLRPSVVPPAQEPRRTALLREAAAKVDASHRFSKVDLAITFRPAWRPGLPDATDASHSVSWVNAHGRTQGTCVHCGECDIGCRVRAKNTLDLNYLAAAENSGAVIRPLCMVSHISPASDGRWTVHCDDVGDGRRVSREFTAPRVILAAGSLGSTEILLRSRDQHRTLPSLSRALGTGWSSNGDFLTPAWYWKRSVAPSRGPTITSAIDFLDGSQGGRFFIEDGGMPGTGSRMADHVMPWFGQAIDGSDGVFTLRRRRLRPWRRRMSLNWNPLRSETAISAMATMHNRMTKATGGHRIPVLTWTWFRALATPHPLGGAAMAASRAAGVVDHAGRVFGHEGLYVMDGAIIPRAVGRNPSKTIAAVAERCVQILIETDRDPPRRESVTHGDTPRRA